MRILKNPAGLMQALCFVVTLTVGPVSASGNSTGNSTGAFDTDCTAFAETLRATPDLANATIWFTEPVAAGTNISLPDYDATCGVQYQVVNVDLCRVAMFVPTSATSNISVEVWLPTKEAWTGRFLSTGNGGISGCIQYYDLTYTVGLGFSAVATNNGHNGTGGEAFLNNVEVVEDFAYRALHTGVVLGKEVSAAFYGEAQNKSYYFGCSTGGRQGFKEAQDFPEDFDGYVIGAPALAFENLTSWSGHFFVDTGVMGDPTFVPLSMWPVIHEDILDQCDDLDGYVDGIIEDAALCSNYTLSSSLLCSNTANSTACLTDVQANTVREIFSPVINNETNSLVYPAMQPGSELLAQYIYYAGSDFPYTTDWFRYVVYNDPTWDPATLSSADYTAAAAQNSFNIQTWEGDLSAVQDRGAKILHYHGQQDMIISSYNSPRYYEFVSETMGLDSSELDEFYRFFKISGMGHCDGGPGATSIGQDIDYTATLDPEGNVLTAMVRWVEEGIAPDTILGTAYVNESLSTADDPQIAFQRRHCKYPLRNVYNGTGDPTVPDSWNCVAE